MIAVTPEFFASWKSLVMTGTAPRRSPHPARPVRGACEYTRVSAPPAGRAGPCGSARISAPATPCPGRAPCRCRSSRARRAQSISSAANSGRADSRRRPCSSWRTSMPRPCSSSGWPMPDNSSSCGELIEPALTTTSRLARASRCWPFDGIAHADAALAFDQQAFGQRIGLDGQVRPAARRIEIADAPCSSGGRCGSSSASCRCRPASRRYSRWCIRCRPRPRP